jgi:hypothetical protein
MMEGRRGQMMARRAAALERRGQSLEDVKPIPPPGTELYEYNPYIPIFDQGPHPLLKTLDRQARKEDAVYQRAQRFIPKPFTAANVFLPAYLEVSYRSCTGCFVRLPQIKRDGIMEIPSPFPAAVHERAGMYYVGRGRLKMQRSGFRRYKQFWHPKMQKR